MNLRFQVRYTAFALLLASCSPAVLLAQENGIIPSPKLLYIQYEFTKPGKDGTPHQMAEAEYVKAEAASKAGPHYVAAVSLSGPSQAIFLYSYPSFADMEVAHKAMMADSTLSAALDRASVADGDLLSHTDATTWVRRDDLSLNSGFRVGSRFYEMSTFTVRPGHGKEWDELVKMVIEGYKKVPDVHWGAYEEAYGAPGNRFLVITTVKSAADLDAEFAQDKQFIAAMGDEGMKKMEQLEAACVEARQTNLFVIDPKMSHPTDVMLKADPDFWNGK
jgi:hypothetical protein